MGIDFQASSGISLFAVVFTNPDHIWQNNTHESSQHPFCKSPPRWPPHCEYLMLSHRFLRVKTSLKLSST